MAGDTAFPAPYHQLSFEVDYSGCRGDECGPRPEWLRRLQYEVTEVWGTSARVAVGERYVVRGKYTLKGEEAFAISLAVFNSAFGATACMAPGSWSFETSTEVLELLPNVRRDLGIVVGRGTDCHLAAWIMLKD